MAPILKNWSARPSAGPEGFTLTPEIAGEIKPVKVFLMPTEARTLPTFVDVVVENTQRWYCRRLCLSGLSAGGGQLNGRASDVKFTGRPFTGTAMDGSGYGQVRRTKTGYAI